MSKRIEIRIDHPRGPEGPTIVRVRSPEQKAGKRRRGGGIVEQLVHDAVKATMAASQQYLRLHERSNRESTKGWLIDLPQNAYEAALEGQRRFCIWKPSED